MKICNIDIADIEHIIFQNFNNTYIDDIIKNLSAKEAIEKLISLKIPFIFSIFKSKNKFSMNIDYYILCQNIDNHVSFKVTEFKSIFYADVVKHILTLNDTSLKYIENTLLSDKSRIQLNSFRLLQKV